MSNNKNQNKKADAKQPQTKAEPKKSAPKTDGAEEVKGIKKLFSQKNLAIVITAISLVVILAVGGIIALVNHIVKDEGFDYATSDLSKYMEFTGDYKNFTVNLEFAKMKDMDLEIAKLSLIKSKKGDILYNGASVVSGYTITPGASVKIWYRGYLKNAEGEPVEVGNMSNFTSANAHTIEIGSASFIPGFELGLVGKNVDEYAKFEKITTGDVKEGQVVYVTFTPSGGTKQSGVRIDLDSNVDENFGEGFREELLKLKIGEEKDKITVKKGGNDFDYTKVTVNFATECEKDSEKQPIIVECYFPYDYSTANLRNETAYFEVYVESAVLYELPEGITEDMLSDKKINLSEEFINSLIEDEDTTITLETLNKYEGANLVEKYDAYARDVINAVYEEEYNELLESAIWEYYGTITQINKYPQIKVDEIYDEYVADVEYQFSYTGGALQDNYGQTTNYYDLDSFACAYLGLSTGYDWRAYLDGLAKSMVEERMILYYLLDLEGLEFTDEEFKEKYDATVNEYLAEYVNQHLAQVSKKTREDFNDAEWEQYVIERRVELFMQYNETFFTERTYYTALYDLIREWPTVITLDDRSAYFDK